MASRNSMQTETLLLERTTSPLYSGKNGRGTKDCFRSHGPYYPRTEAIWKIEGTRSIFYGLLDFSKPIHYSI